MAGVWPSWAAWELDGKGKAVYQILLALVLRGAGVAGNEVVRGTEAAGIDAARAGSGMASGCGQ